MRDYDEGRADLRLEARGKLREAYDLLRQLTMTDEHALELLGEMADEMTDEITPAARSYIYRGIE